VITAFRTIDLDGVAGSCDSGSVIGWGAIYDQVSSSRALGRARIPFPGSAPDQRCHHAIQFHARAAKANHPKPSRTSFHSLRKLSHSFRLASHPGGSRIRSQQNEISSAWHARKSAMHPVSRKARLHRCGKKLCRLPRGYSPSPDGIKL
jgi:hypothetical protein